MNTNIIRCKNVSSTAPMIGRISPWAMPSCSHAAAMSRMRRSKVCMTLRRALGEHPHMRLQMEMAEKLADGFSPHAAFEAKHKQSGHDQADEPVSACLGFPQRRLRIAVAAVHRLEVTMHTAFGKSGVLRKASDALLPVFTNRVENDQALGPQSHSGGPCSEGWLTWCLKSALQSTRSTTHCPALETWPCSGMLCGYASLIRRGSCG